jgi:uracil-DNA glycosylase
VPCLPPSGPAARDIVLLGCFHVSQQNTFTGRLTAPMLDAVLLRAREIAATAADRP